MRKAIGLFLIIASLFSCTKNEIVINSPNNNLKVTLKTTEKNRLVYEVSQEGKVVIETSILGIIREDADFASNLKIVEITDVEEIQDNYTLTVHKKEDYCYLANQQIVTLENNTGKIMEVIFQVSNKGVAFRYHFPSESTEVKKITRELSSFAFNKDTKAWLQPCAEAKTSWGNCNPSYEEHYLQDITVGTPSPQAGWVFPSLFKTHDTWVLISETGVDRNYCASRLSPKSPNGVYSIGFPDEREVVFSGELNPQSTLPWYTPWRIISVGSLADIVESSLGTDLSQPAIDGDFSWVKPGRASWSWVLLKDNETIYPVQKEFIDYAADMGWEYCLIDAGWDVQIGYAKIKELADYAKTKEVNLILWYNSSGDWNTTPQTPKSALLTSEARIKEFTRIKEMGIAGVKIDFFGGDGQSVMNHYIDILEDAAKIGLAVNFHGCTLPRGWQRTYPHLVSMEAIKGMEFITFDQANADVAANHCTMLPFTRNVFDPMDFTPTCFGEIDNIERKTSNGFELALPVIFQSGVQHYAEIPKVMNKVPGYVKQLMKDIPVVWDETKFIDGFPGKYVIMARRSGDSWFIAGINGQDEIRNLSIDLSFIEKANGIMVTDGESNRSFVKKEIKSAELQKIDIAIKAQGGFIIKLTN
ncbi:MAG: glycoside hydrolase family 97 catalytic domain-containing protein [Salinivirgaceae bacterium]|jgi:alpha-glucosidase|nr:glycoside hydrolase family 97 catalytic domain-containing protein [Salinivirgaceae bacterium]